MSRRMVLPFAVEYPSRLGKPVAENDAQLVTLLGKTRS